MHALVRLAVVVAACAATATWAEAPSEDPVRRVDVELTAFASTPERFVLCVGFHPGRPVEVDLCGGVDRGLTTVSAHGYYRKRWSFPHSDGARVFVMAVGPGLGARVMHFCPYSVCADALGPELLASVELVEWLSASVGLTLQLDAGVAALWTAAAPGMLESVLRFPLRALVGVAF